MLLVLDRICGLIYVQFVHPGRGLGRDGDHRWGGCGPLRVDETFIRHPGAKGKALGHYDPMRLKWLNNPGGKPQTPCDPGLCKIFPEAKTATKAWARASANRRTTTTGILASVCVHATLRFFLPSETALPFSPRAKLCPTLIET